MQGKDFQNFSSFYDEFFKKIYNYVFYRAGRHRERAEDMTSEIFLKALENFETFDKRKSFQAWIFRIAHNHVIDYYRARKPEPAAIEDVASELKSFDRVLDRLIHDQDMDRVLSALDGISEDHREIINLKYFNDFSHDEISEITGKTEGNVRVWAHRALLALKKTLGDSGDRALKDDTLDQPHDSAEYGKDEKRKPLQSVLKTATHLFSFLTIWKSAV